MQELLGHANITTTQVYTRLDFQHLAKAYDAAHPRERGAMLEGLNGINEGEPGEPVDVFDDVTARPASEAMEPVGDAANGQRCSGVVVERAAAHEALAAPGQFDAT